MNKCAICGTRPKSADGEYCTPCGMDIEMQQAEREARVKWWLGAEYVLVYKDHVISLVANGDMLRVTYQGMPSVRSVPPEKLVKLDEWCPGFQRQTIKRFKGAFRPYIATMPA